ncbi:MAG TPA: hypothetical protein VHW26_06095 [Solirubrobacteraceae bacterium]|nr:hypothetical protein [Solirubrobacteraceae bacterium]
MVRPDDRRTPEETEPPADADEPEGADFELEPRPARSDQLPEEAPEPVAPD